MRAALHSAVRVRILSLAARRSRLSATNPAPPTASQSRAGPGPVKARAVGAPAWTGVDEPGADAAAGGDDDE